MEFLFEEHCQILMEISYGLKRNMCIQGQNVKRKLIFFNESGGTVGKKLYFFDVHYRGLE